MGAALLLQEAPGRASNEGEEMTIQEQQAIELLRGLLIDHVRAVHATNAGRSTKTADRRMEEAAYTILTALMGREPTDAEVKAALTV